MGMNCLNSVKSYGIDGLWELLTMFEMLVATRLSLYFMIRDYKVKQVGHIFTLYALCMLWANWLSIHRGGLAVLFRCEAFNVK